MKKCETFGCANPGAQNYLIAPGTSLWLCKSCIQEIQKQGQKTDSNPYPAPRKAA